MYRQEEAYLALAKLQQRKGIHSEAQDILSKVAKGANAGGRDGILIQTLILQAISFSAQGQVEAALDSLEKCLTIAQPEQYLTAFLDEGSQVEALLHELQARGLPQPLQTYTEEIVQAFAQVQC